MANVSDFITVAQGTRHVVFCRKLVDFKLGQSSVSEALLGFLLSMIPKIPTIIRRVLCPAGRAAVPVSR